MKQSESNLASEDKIIASGGLYHEIVYAGAGVF